MDRWREGWREGIDLIMDHPGCWDHPGCGICHPGCWVPLGHSGCGITQLWGHPGARSPWLRALIQALSRPSPQGQPLAFPAVALWVTVALAVCVVALLGVLAFVCHQKIRESCREDEERTGKSRETRMDGGGGTCWGTLGEWHCDTCPREPSWPQGALPTWLFPPHLPLFPLPGHLWRWLWAPFPRPSPILGCISHFYGAVLAPEGDFSLNSSRTAVGAALPPSGMTFFHGFYSQFPTAGCTPSGMTFFPWICSARSWGGPLPASLGSRDRNFSHWKQQQRVGKLTGSWWVLEGGKG